MHACMHACMHAWVYFHYHGEAIYRMNKCAFVFHHHPSITIYRHQKGKFSGDDAASEEARAVAQNPMELAIQVLLKAVARDVVNDFALRPLLAQRAKSTSTANVASVPKSEGFITVNEPVSGAPTVTFKPMQLAKNSLRWAMFRWKSKRKKKQKPQCTAALKPRFDCDDDEEDDELAS